MGGQTCGATQKQKRAEKRKKRATGDLQKDYNSLQKHLQKMGGQEKTFAQIVEIM